MNDKRGLRPDLDQVDPEIAEVIGALRGPATPEELREQEHYLQVFDTVGPGPGRVVELTDDRAKPLRTVRIGSKVAAAVAAMLVVAVGAAAAYTGNLPRGLQSSAHRLLGVQAPPATSTSAGPTTAGSTPRATAATSATSGVSGVPGRSLPPTGGATPSSVTPIGPTGSTIPTLSTPPGVTGLCTAWSRGGLATTSTSYKRLATAAGGRDHIASYCAGVLATSTPTASSSATSHGRSAHATKNAARATKAQKTKGPKRPEPDKPNKPDATTDGPV
jgi:hypothetical protein